MTPRLLPAAPGAPAAGSAGPSPCARGHKLLALCAGRAWQAARLRPCAARLPWVRLMCPPCTPHTRLSQKRLRPRSSRLEEVKGATRCEAGPIAHEDLTQGLDSMTKPQAWTKASVARCWHSQPHTNAPVQHARPMHRHPRAAAAGGSEAPAAQGTGSQGPHGAGEQRAGGRGAARTLTRTLYCSWKPTSSAFFCFSWSISRPSACAAAGARRALTCGHGCHAARLRERTHSELGCFTGAGRHGGVDPICWAGCARCAPLRRRDSM
jgi:hypothetical protein